MSGAPSLLEVPEGGEFKQGTITEGRESYKLATYGRIFALTRQAIVNNDLESFSRMGEMWGRAAADLESDAVYGVLTANPTMGDGVALFHTTHGNLAGAGAAVSAATVQTAETSMLTRTGLEGRYINLMPKFLIVAPGQKVAAQQLLNGTMVPTQTSNVNVYANSMDLVVEARLTATAGASPWFIAGDPAQADTVEYAYLDGQEGVFLEQRDGFEVDGVEYKARLDFAAKAIDFRGLYKNPGV